MCNCSSAGKDRTNEAVFAHLAKANLKVFEVDSAPRGFGLFSIPAPEVGILEFKTLTVENLTYTEAVKRGSNCVAFQWIPVGITVKLTTGEEVSIRTTADIDTIARDCTSSPCKASGCPMGCFCFSGESGNCHH